MIRIIRDLSNYPIIFYQRKNLFTFLKRGWTKPSFLLVEKEVGPININSTYTKKCIDPIKVIISTNRSDDSTNKKEGFVPPLLRKVNKFGLLNFTYTHACVYLSINIGEKDYLNEINTLFGVGGINFNGTHLLLHQ